MGLVVEGIAIEVTRDCNLICKNFCMRGDRQKIYIKQEYVDLLLNNIKKHGINVTELLFSGGEPTLNEDIIIHVVKRIIQENIMIDKIRIISNGHIISLPIIKAFEAFVNYKKKCMSTNDNDFILNLANSYMKKYATINISKDNYHNPLSGEHWEKYKKMCENIHFDFLGDKDEILFTGLADKGKPFQYKLEKILKIDNFVFNSFYLTATGFITTTGDGMYKDMDNINLGHITEVDLLDLINNPLYQDNPKFVIPDDEEIYELLKK